MKILGIIGGIAPGSTIEYYRLIVEGWRSRVPESGYPPVIINSIDLDRMIGMVATRAYDGLAAYLSDEIGRLVRAGADLALLASNTPHVVFDALRERSPLPLVSIVEATCDVARGIGLKRPGLIGTRFTMQGSFYPAVFSRQGLTLVTPTPTEQAFIHEKYMTELVKGLFSQETRECIFSIARRMKKEQAADGLILGGTELPLLLRAESHDGMPILDTTRIHVDAALARLMP